MGGDGRLASNGGGGIRDPIVVPAKAETHTTVIPAKAGIHFDLAVACGSGRQQQKQRQNGFRLSPE
ncbi:hypothetical protein [Pseudomonas sp. CGJS7]|uniref:hypothetical protein n=1 Tax=Pseudomonas sp. CGJS7 TaxID=3109348 RepID=UPI00300BF17E